MFIARNGFPFLFLSIYKIGSLLDSKFDLSFPQEGMGMRDYYSTPSQKLASFLHHIPPFRDQECNEHTR